MSAKKTKIVPNERRIGKQGHKARPCEFPQPRFSSKERTRAWSAGECSVQFWIRGQILDAPVKSYADVVYQESLMESASALRDAKRDYLREAAAKQSSNLPLGGPQVQAIVNLHVQHIERCMEARLDSYRQAFTKANQVPSEQDFADILNDVKAVQELQARHSTSSLIDFVRTRGIHSPGDPTTGVMALSGHGHDRVLGVWKIWREGVRLQRSATPIAPTDPSLEKQRPERNALGWLWEKIWRWEVVAVGSTSVYGAGIAAMYGDDYLVAGVLYFVAIGWLTAKILAWEETKVHGKRVRISVLVLLVAFLAVASSLFWMRHRKRSHESELSRTQTPINKDKEIVEQHQATDSVTPSVDRSHRESAVTPKAVLDATPPSKAQRDDRIASEARAWIAEQLGVPQAEVIPGARLVEDLGADPLDKTELKMSLEEGFGIQIPDAKWRAIRTVQDVIDYVQSRVKSPKKEHQKGPPRADAARESMASRPSPQTGAPKTPTPNAMGQTPSQTPPQAALSSPPATFLDRVVQENRGLTPDDRNRLSTELYECDQFIKQSQAVGYKLNTEFGKLSNDRQSGALAKNVDDHIKFLRDLDESAWSQYHGLQRLQEKWQYFPDQTEYVFGDNPFNAGEGLLVNAVEGMSGSLTSWSKISNRDQQEILNIEAQQQADFEKDLRQFFDWANGTLQRIKQMRQSLDPNGVVQPIPTKTAAPAPAMFSSN